MNQQDALFTWKDQAYQQPVNIKAWHIPIVVYMLSLMMENTHWAEKKATTRCGIRERAKTRNFVLWLFLNNHDVG